LPEMASFIPTAFLEASHVPVPTHFGRKEQRHIVAFMLTCEIF
jgi:hypothetical protein